MSISARSLTDKRSSISSRLILTHLDLSPSILLSQDDIIHCWRRWCRPRLQLTVLTECLKSSPNCGGFRDLSSYIVCKWRVLGAIWSYGNSGNFPIEHGLAIPYIERERIQEIVSIALFSSSEVILACWIFRRTDYTILIYVCKCKALECHPRRLYAESDHCKE